MRRLAAIGGVWIAVLVSGCAKPLEVSSITEIKPQAGATGLDVYASRRAKGEQVPELAGDQIVEVRTYSEADGSTGQEEIPGAQCRLSTPSFNADFTSPAKVRVPIYRSQSSALAVSCRKDGFNDKLEEVAVFNATKNERLSLGANGGLIGVALALAVNGMSDASQDDFKYPLVRIVMARKGPAGRVAASDARGVPQH